MDWKFNVRDIVYCLDESLSGKSFDICDRRFRDGCKSYLIIRHKARAAAEWVEEKHLLSKSEYIEAARKFSIGQDVIVSSAFLKDSYYEKLRNMKGLKYQIQNVTADNFGDIWYFVNEFWFKESRIEEYIEFKEITSDEINDILG